MTLGSPVFDIDQQKVTITDTTSYSSPARNELALYFKAYKMDKDGNDTELAVTGNSTPDLITSFSFPVTIDGWYKVLAISITVFNIVDSYVTNDIVFNSGNLYIALQASTGNLPTNPTYFSPVSIDAALVSGGNVTEQYFDYVFVEYGKQCAGNAVGEWAKKYDCGACNKTDLMASWLQRDAMVYAIERFYAISQYSKAEEISRKLENLCESC